MGIEEEAERQLFFGRAVGVYQIPPRATFHGGYRAQEWVPPRAKHLDTCRIRVVAVGKKATIRLQNQHTGELFAEAPIREPLERYVEPVIDSSRYFVLRVEDETSGSHALLGMGFEERSDAFDFNVALQDHMRQDKTEREASQKPIDWGPTRDLSLKEGETLSVKIPGKSKAKAPPADTTQMAGALARVSLGPPAPQGSRRRAQIEALQGPKAAGAAEEAPDWLVEAAEEGGKASDGVAWADFDGFDSDPFAAAAATGDSVSGATGADAGFGDFQSAGAGGEFGDFGDTDWAADLQGLEACLDPQGAGK